MAPKRRLRAPKSLTADQRAKLFAVVREGWLAKPETGYSIRQIAAAVGISKSTLSDWVLGPLSDELEAAVSRDRAEQPKHRNHPGVILDEGRASLGHVAVTATMQEALDDSPPDQVEQPRGRQYESTTIRDYHPEWQFGGVRTSLGTRSPTPRPMIAIPPNFRGEKPNPPVFPFPDVPLIQNRRKGQAWYHDPNRK